MVVVLGASGDLAKKKTVCGNPPPLFPSRRPLAFCDIIADIVLNSTLRSSASYSQPRPPLLRACSC